MLNGSMSEVTVEIRQMNLQTSWLNKELKNWNQTIHIYRYEFNFINKINIVLT
uniref:Uncharacterized protein n=1 Tax=Arion vulgaris TaxID=1028688 RepID=A0A0B6ZQR8_9EUPU